MTEQGTNEGYDTRAAGRIRLSIRIVAILVVVACLAALAVALLATRPTGRAPEPPGDLQSTAQQDPQPANVPETAGPRPAAVNAVSPAAAAITQPVATPIFQEPT